MARDYARVVRALRAKAADQAVPASERTALLERAAEMEKRHNLKNETVKPLHTDTTITDRSGQTASFNLNDFLRQWQHNYEEAVRETDRLWKTQADWNRPPDDDLSDDYGYETWINGGSGSGAE